MPRRDHDPYKRGYPMAPEWGRPSLDPNWKDGEYHGLRMRYDHRQAAYGFHRQSREADLQGYGGFDGIYDEGPGTYDRAGVFRHPYFQGRLQHGSTAPLAAGTADSEFRHVEDGGVRADNEYLRQYNADSPALQAGGGDRGFGHAPAGAGEGELTRPDLRAEGTDERGYAGYNQGGFAPEQGSPGLDPRK